MTLTKAISLKVIIISFFLFSSSTLTAQVFDFLNGKNSVDIPFEFSHNFLLVEVKFQNVVPLTMMFDTGAEHTVLFDKVFTDLFNVPYDRKIKIFGSDLSQELYANVARNVYLNVDGLADIPRDIVVLEEDYYHLKEITGINIDGIISTSFFNNLSFKIDFKRNIITLYNPQVFKAPSNFDVADADYIK
ncbi:MAG: aspartyl protease family protein, partial [Bacteroidota bacterium]